MGRLPIYGTLLLYAAWSPNFASTKPVAKHHAKPAPWNYDPVASEATLAGAKDTLLGRWRALQQGPVQEEHTIPVVLLVCVCV